MFKKQNKNPANCLLVENLVQYLVKYTQGQLKWMSHRLKVSLRALAKTIAQQTDLKAGGI